MISCSFFEGSCFVLTLCGEFFWVSLCCLWLCPFFKNQIVFGLSLSFDFFVFYYFFR